MLCFTCGSATYSPMFNSNSLSIASNRVGSASLLVDERSAIAIKLRRCFFTSRRIEYMSGSKSEWKQE